MRICLAYDCLYPYTVGGAERWYRNLAHALVEAGHEVTYLTRRQWPVGETPDVPGVRVVAVSRLDPLYGEDGNRLIGPPLRFGAGVLRHLLANRGRYDALHLCSFPYFSLLGARVGLAGSRVPIGVDWFEVWSHGYWRDYLGPLGGRVGEFVQRLCARLTPQAYVFSRLHGQRLARLGLPSDPIALGGLYAGPTETDPPGRARARSAGGVRGPPHPREAAAAHTGRGGRGARARPRPAGAGARRRPRATGRARRHRRHRHGRTSSTRRASSPRRSCAMRLTTRPATCCRRVARATGWW